MSQLARPQAITGSSWISSVPIATPDTIPWGWNPAATYMTAYYTQQENQRKQREFQMDSEMERILFPLKVQTAQMNLEKLVAERDRTMLNNEIIRKNDRERSRIATKTAQDILTGQTGANFQSQYNFGANLAPTAQAQPAVKTSWRVVTPVATNPKGP